MKLEGLRNWTGWGVALVLFVFAVMDRCDRPSPSLTAIVDYGPVLLPDRFDSLYSAIQGKFSIEDLRKGIEPPADYVADLNPEQRNAISEYFFDEFHSLSRQVLPGRFSWAFPFGKGCWRVTLKNGERTEVTEVDLVLPYANLARIKHEGEPATETAIDGLVHIGRMSPDETVEVTAWTAIDLRESSFSGVRVRHKGGMGEIVAIEKSERAEHWWNSFLPLLYWLIICLVWFFGYYLGWNNAVKSVRSENSQKPGEANGNLDAGPDPTQS